MAAILSLHDLFEDMLKDIYYAEKKILKALPKMAKKLGTGSKVAAAFKKHTEETEGQLERLVKVFEMLGKTPKGKKCDAIEGLTAEADELMANADDQAILEAGLVAGAQAVEHYEMARYGTLVEWARLLDMDEAAELLQETLDQEKKTDETLNDIARDGVNEAALECHSQDEDVSLVAGIGKTRKSIR